MIRDVIYLLHYFFLEISISSIVGLRFVDGVQSTTYPESMKEISIHGESCNA
jgi:hypothetical protein